MKKEEFYSASVQTLIILLGNTFGIWFTYILGDIVFNSFIKWPGFLYFLNDGSLLVITFSILTTVILSTTTELKLNFYNIISFVLMILTSLVFARNMGLNGQNQNVLLMILPVFCSLVLLFFALKNQKSLFRKHSWLKNAKTGAFYYDVFLSFAIAGNKNRTHREEVENCISQIDFVLRECGYNSIFNASQYFDQKHEKQQPADAAQEDFAAVENSRNFILFYPEIAATSALMELGYALRDKRNILIITKNIHTLPFLARGMSEVHNNVRTLFYDNFEDCIESIKKNHKIYFN